MYWSPGIVATARRRGSRARVSLFVPRPYATHGRIADAVLAVLQMSGQLNQSPGVAINGHGEVVPTGGVRERPMTGVGLARLQVLPASMARILVDHTHLGRQRGHVANGQCDAAAVRIVARLVTEVRPRASGHAALERPAKTVRPVRRKALASSHSRTTPALAG